MTELGKRMHLRKQLLIENHGEPSKQKTELVRFILASFESPDKWPLTDQERCALLRKMYEMASIIRNTEEAVKDAEVRP